MTLRKANQADVGEQFQHEDEVAFFTRLAFFGFTGRLMPGLGEMLVAAPTTPAVNEDDALSGLGEIGEALAGLLVGNDGAHGDEENHIVAGMAAALGAFAVASAIGAKFAIEAITQQSVIVLVGFEHNAAAMAAIAAGRAAAWHVFFATEGDAAVSSVAALHVDFGFINEHGVCLSGDRSSPVSYKF